MMMVQSAPVSRTLLLPAARPPTPPRDSSTNTGNTKRTLLPPARPSTSSRNLDTNSKPPNLFSRMFTRTVSSQADITPDSSSELKPRAEHSKKKVAWDDSGSSSGLEVSAQLLPTERKPIKSILKPYNGSLINIAPSKLSPPHTYANLAAMLESVAQQLAGTDRNSKMDAYTTLSGVLKASDNVPDVRALKEKIGLLLAFIRRDLTEKTSAGTLDTTLVVNALILLSIFLHRPAIADNITADFSASLVDHAIKTFQDASMSKDVVKHLMLVLAEQKFSSKVMSGDRVSRLISSLHEIESFVKGKSIVMGRMNIYRTLLRQSTTHMSTNTDWMHDLFGDMFSTVKEIRTTAVIFGLEAGYLLGTESKATRAFMELFSGDLGDGTRFGDYYIARLKANIIGRNDAACVPQIWSIPVLFLRSKPRQFEQWSFMNPWLGLVQQCFNCSDQQARLEANLAWNRLVFAVCPDERTSSGIITLLYKPLGEQIRRRSKGRMAALGSLCNLLYYSMKPTSTNAQLDLYWDRYINEALGKVLAPPVTPASSIEQIRRDLVDACHILTGLFDSTTPRKWSESRAVAAYGKEMFMETTELPALDSKWLRKSAGRVFPIISPLIEKLYWDMGEETEAISTLWKAYITSVASPAIMEVKVSNETMSCVACIFGLIYKIWQIGPKSLQTVPLLESASSTDFLQSFEGIISITISGIGLLPFTEKLLSIGNKDEFVVIATPSHQPRMARGEPKCPLHHLLVLMATVSPGLEYDGNFTQLIRRIVGPFLDARPSKRAKLDLVLELLSLLPMESNEPCRLIWSVLADIATFITATRDSTGSGLSGMSDQPLGAEYRKFLGLLEAGLNLSPSEPLPGWKVLFETLVTSATIDAGQSGRAIAVIEPLSCFLYSKLSQHDTNSLQSHPYLRLILQKVTYPKDRQAFDAARRKLWSTVAPKPSSFDPYSLLYDLLRESLETAYVSYTTSLTLEYSDLITATSSFLANCPISLLTNVLIKLQSGIASWIKDEHSHLSGGTALSQSITSLWSKLCQLLSNLSRDSSPSKLLAELEVLLCSGLESRHRSIVNSSVRLWTSSFGNTEEHFDYPANLKLALLSIHNVTELQLPFFSESLQSDGIVDQRQLPDFADTQGDVGNFSRYAGSDSDLRAETAAQFNKISPSSSTRLLRSYTPQVLIGVAIPQKRSRESTPDSTKRKSRQRNIVPKLRHDDSQIQFQAIDSSPINDAALESQLLTNRQKEVKERQQTDAAMFPDLRSSPRPRDKTEAGPELELPLHRSATVPLVDSSSGRGRQTIAPQIDYDEFVNSSPTPTRSLHIEVLPEPPSSPREALWQHSKTFDEDAMDIPSSPPEISQDHPLDTQMPLGHLDQANLHIGESIPALLTTESAPQQQNGHTFEANLTPKASDPDTIEDNAITEVPLSLALDQISTQNAAEAAPGTPPRGRESSPIAFQTPRSEIFHDTQTSPSSSDKNMVFEDAVSSPRLGINEVDEQQQSSPISYLDESSALRMMVGYDQGSGRPRRSPRHAKHAPPKEDQIISTKRSPPRVSGQDTEDSSMASFVPETPKPAVHLQVVDGEEIDLEETIVVDDSILQQQASAVKRRKRKSLDVSDVDEISASKKARHEESTQDREQEEEKILTKERRVPKKRRDRSKRPSSVTSGRYQPSPSRSLTSVDMEGSVEEYQEMEADTVPTANEALAVIDAEQSMQPHPIVEQVETDYSDECEESVGRNNQSERQRSTDDSNTKSSAVSDNRHTSNLDIVSDTISGDSNPAITAASEPSHSKQSGSEGLKTVSKIMTMSLVPVDPALSTPTDASMQTESMVEGPTFEGTKAKLQQIIGNLNAMPLSRAEMNELEDLFVDAKQQLYGAEQRGRSKS